MLGLYAIAFLAPLLVFGMFGFFIKRLPSKGNTIFKDQQKALTLYVYIPIGLSYGLIIFTAAIKFTQYIQKM